MRFRYLAGLSLAVALAAPVAYAQELGTHVNGGVEYNNGFHWSLGYFFEVYEPFTVNYLAFYDAGGDGFIQSHDVGIFDASGLNLLASATLASGSGAPLVEQFRLVAIAPLTLGIGTYQVLGSTGDELYNSLGVLTNAPGIKYLGEAWCQSEGLSPNCGTETGNNGWFGANFAGGTNVVPEPASMALLGTGLVGLYGAIRRRREQKE